MEPFTVKETENECRKSLSRIEQTDRNGCSLRKQVIRTHRAKSMNVSEQIYKNNPSTENRSVRLFKTHEGSGFLLENRINHLEVFLSIYCCVNTEWDLLSKPHPTKRISICVCVCVRVRSVCVFQHLPSRCLSTAWFWSQMLLNVLQRDRPSGRGFLRTHPPQAYW